MRGKVRLHEERMSWEGQLLDNLNAIQGSKEKRHNLRVERDKLSLALKQLCGNEAVTSYYQLEQVESFETLKTMVEKLIFSPTKELKFIAFVTYDYNRDGFIC